METDPNISNSLNYLLTLYTKYKVYSSFDILFTSPFQNFEISSLVKWGTGFFQICLVGGEGVLNKWKWVGKFSKNRQRIR